MKLTIVEGQNPNLLKKEFFDDYDWQQAFNYAQGEDVSAVHPGYKVDESGFGMTDILHIEGKDEGENDGDGWIIYGSLKDGRWFFLNAWCDYTGWGCQEGGRTVVANNKEDIIKFGMDAEARGRLGIK